MSAIEDLKKERAEAKAKSQEIKNRQNVLYKLKKSGDVARIRFLLDMDAYLKCDLHDKWDEFNYDNNIKAVCAASFGLQCAYCAQSKRLKDRQLAASRILVLPVWLHEISNTESQDDDDDDQSGLKIFVLKRYSQSAGHLIDFFEEHGSIQKCDWKYTRSGSGLNTEYMLTSKAPSTFQHDIPVPSLDDIRSLLVQALPYRVEQQQNTVPSFLAKKTVAPKESSPVNFDEHPF